MPPLSEIHVPRHADGLSTNRARLSRPCRYRSRVACSPGASFAYPAGPRCSRLSRPRSAPVSRAIPSATVLELISLSRFDRRDWVDPYRCIGRQRVVREPYSRLAIRSTSLQHATMSTQCQTCDSVRQRLVNNPRARAVPADAAKIDWSRSITCVGKSGLVVTCRSWWSDRVVCVFRENAGSLPQRKGTPNETDYSFQDDLGSTL